ncbi:hypothetical protein CVT24_002329 [Panaeolus cyanescens]|uniref:Nucleolar protein 12 n=1 Tax=Panaeolus cyanescens TaxID=181874 RepID=A0A409YIJ5_9AGAR|nr:hypothetical protein CVT24_002329 [Panaeolus cyanescens]
MSLSTLLLASAPGIDTELDSLFKSSVSLAPNPAPPSPGPSKIQEFHGKKRKQTDEKESSSKTSKRTKTSDKATLKNAHSVDNTPKSPVKDKKTKEKKGKGKEKELQPITDAADVEHAETKEKSGETESLVQPHSEADADNEEEDDEVDLTKLVHESLDPKAKSSRKAKTKVVPEDETPERRNQRTIFIGNLPLEVASKRPLSKQLQRHIISFVPSAKVESIRFRSIPFQAPTAKLPTSDDEDSGKPSKKPSKEPRAHDKERTSAWRSKVDQQDEESVKKDEKRYLTPGQKKKVAYINQEFHTTADTVNAYIVFAHPPNTENRPANLPPLPPVLDPYEAARLAVEKADGTIFMERMIRVDLVSKDKRFAPDTAKEGDKASAIVTEDPKLSVFVGNLDFASKEEDLRVFFEGIVAGERGPPDVALKGEAEGDPQKPLTWVTRVRIVRDKDTQLGKGFAYVQFADRVCVDELLALDQDKLKFAKRKLRVQRCKTLPGSSHSIPINTGSTKEKAGSSVARPVVVVPKGNPQLGAALVGLSKEERKKVKSTDADRVARRLAKKKARNAMKPSTKPIKSGKERKRVRS